MADGLHGKWPTEYFLDLEKRLGGLHACTANGWEALRLHQSE